MHKPLLLSGFVFLFHATSAKSDLQIQDFHANQSQVLEQSVLQPLDQSVPSRQQIQDLFDRGSSPTIRPAGAWAGSCYASGKAEGSVLVFIRKDIRLTFDVFGSGKSGDLDPFFYDRLTASEGRRLVISAPRRTRYKYSGIDMGNEFWNVARNRSGSHMCSLQLRQNGKVLLYSWDHGQDYCIFRKRIDRDVF